MILVVNLDRAVDEIEHLILRLQQTASNFAVSGPKADDDVVTLERTLGITLPPSYRSFILRFGAICRADAIISGIWRGDSLLGSADTVTELFRRQHRLPARFIVIQPDDEAPYCLDSGRLQSDGEYPVVCYELQHDCVSDISRSFGDFILDWLRLRVQAYEG